MKAGTNTSNDLILMMLMKVCIICNNALCLRQMHKYTTFNLEYH